jgi:Ca2+-binding RTX toxin-like protein
VRGEVVGQQYDDNQGSLQKVGSYQDAGGNLHTLFSFDAPDLPEIDVLNSVTFTVAAYKGGLSQADLVGKVGTFVGMENEQVYFSVDMGKDGAASEFSEADHIAVFLGELTDTQLAEIADPQQANIKSQGMNTLADFYNQVTHDVTTEGWDEWVFAWAGAGDVLTGGADADTFAYAAGDGVDEITDFTRAQGDVLKLVGIDQGSVEVLNDAEDSFVVFKAGAGYEDGAIRIVGVNDYSATEILFA